MRVSVFALNVVLLSVPSVFAQSPRTTPAAFKTRRCWLISGWVTPSAPTSSCTQRSDSRSCSTMAIRTGAASARRMSPAAANVSFDGTGAGGAVSNG